MLNVLQMQHYLPEEATFNGDIAMVMSTTSPQRLMVMATAR